jgi:TonB C terminal
MAKMGSGPVRVGVGGKPGVKSNPRPSEVGTRGSIEFCEFSPRQTISLIDSRVIISGACAAISTLLHLALLAATIFPNNRAPAHPNPVVVSRATYREAADEGDLLLVDEKRDGVQLVRSSPPILSTPQLVNISVTAPAVSPAANSFDVAESDEHADGANDSDSHAKIYGAYLGQISARIDRAWIRPHIPIGAQMFLCHVLIDQDARGNVLEVTLHDCNGTTAWQQSLVNAVMSASPLPSPSDPTGFAPRVQVAFRETEPNEEFAATRALTDAGVNLELVPQRGAGPLAAFRRIRSTGAHPVGNSSIALRITGPADVRLRTLRPAGSNPAGQTPPLQQNH